MKKTNGWNARKGRMTGVKTLMLALTVLATANMFAFVSHAAGTGKITADGVNVRKEASTGSEKVASAEQNATVTVNGKKTGSDGRIWYQVSVDGATGYIRSDLINVSDEASVPSLDAAAPAAGSSTPTTSTPDETVVQVTAVNPVSANVKGSSPVRVRQNASTTSRIVSTAEGGLALTVNGTAKGTDGNDWYQVNFIASGSQVIGFIRADYVTLSGELTEPGSAETSQDTAKDPVGEQTTGNEDGNREKDWETMYGEGKWHLIDNVSGSSYDIDQIFSSVEANTETLKSTLHKNQTMEIIIFVLVIVIVILISVISILGFKLRDMSDEAYFEEAEREALRKKEVRRTTERPAERMADRPVERPRNQGHPVQQRRPQGSGAEGASRRPVQTSQGAPARSSQTGAQGAVRKPAQGTSQRPVQDAPVRRPANRNASAERPERQGHAVNVDRPARNPMPRQENPKAAFKPKNFVENDEFEYQFLDWDEDQE